jgi:hypothetical protein
MNSDYPAENTDHSEWNNRADTPLIGTISTGERFRGRVAGSLSRRRNPRIENRAVQLTWRVPKTGEQSPLAECSFR